MAHSKSSPTHKEKSCGELGDRDGRMRMTGEERGGKGCVWNEKNKNKNKNRKGTRTTKRVE